MNAAKTPLIETLVESLIETSLRLQKSLCGGVPEGINGELLRCGELLTEIRQQADIAEIIVPAAGGLKSRLGYLREILASNDALLREGSDSGKRILRAMAGGGQGTLYSGKGVAEELSAGAAVLNARG